ncbi:MAG: hypothetical protein IJ040_03130 [Lachnospiraceae bacterium]|nr:hypothetical protein [Lachnospiraceae bacterium]
MEYVDGSFCIQNLWEWNDANRVYLVPVVGSNGETIAYDFQTSDDRVAPFLAKSFQIVYITKITDADTGVKKDASFTNSASVTVDFEGDITVKDTAVSTVTGTPGGTLDKEYSYKPGTDYVDWTVTINEARNNMEDIENPILRDQLAEYFDYVSGTLYRMDADGNLSAVTEPYYATAINNQLIVQLPDIGSDCLVFKFRTRFNVLAAELIGQKIQNSVTLEGVGHLYENQSNAIENVAFSSSSAGSSVKREIRIKKTDASTGNPLAGAEFELLLGTEVIATAVSGDDGYAVFEISGAGLDLSQNYTFKLKETIAPDGYQVSDTPPSGYQYDSNKAIIINDCTEANLKTSTDGTKYYELVVPNASINDSTEIIIQKKDNSTPQLALPGALFGLYSDSNCTNLVAKRTSDAEGKVVFSGIKIDGDTGNATYYVKEITPPAGYKINNSLVEVSIKKNGTGIYVVTYSFDGNVDQTSCTLIDEKALGTYTITKTDTSSPAQVLPDAEFGLYRDALCRDLITTVTTDASGKATFTDLELGKTYYYRESVAPDGYVLDSTIRSFVVGTGLENDDVHDEITITNEAQVGRIVVTKVDNNVPAKPLAGVEFTLYESTGNTPVSIPGVTNTVTTDSSGIAVFNDIPFGKYVLKETDGLAGYKVAADQNVIVNQLDDTEITVVNEIIYIDVVVNKTDNASPAQPLSGAVFGLYTSNGIFVRSGITDENGYLIFKDVPYGDYYLEEMEAPEGYTKWTGREGISKTVIDDKIRYSQPLIFEYTIENAKQNGSIVITKVDDVKPNPNPVAGAEFILYDENMLIVDRAFSDTDGKITFSELKYGTYYIEEIQAPEGYIRDTGVYKVVVNSDTPVTKHESGTTDNDSLTIVNKKLAIIAPLISFKLKKVDESGKPLADAVFELYADGVGTGITMTSDASGMVYFRRITVTGYSEDTVFSVREVSSPSGYTMDSVNINLGTRVESPYADSDDVTKWLSDAEIRWAGDGSASNAEIENQQILGNIWVTKTGLLSTLLLPGAEITLYEADGITPVSITGVTNPVVTNNQGVATFANLPIGTYYVKETKAPAGYTLNTTAQKVVVTESKTYEVSIKDSPILVYVSKQSLTGVTELPGAQMSIRKNSQDGTIVYSYTTSDTVERIPASLLETGTTYYIVEEQAPNGYGYMEPVGFTVANDGTITISGGELKGNTIVVRDRKIDLSISKRDSANQTNELSGAIFGLYDENGVEVERFTSGTSAYNLTALVAPKSGYTQYTIKEITAPDGYETAAPVKFAVKYDGTIYTINDVTGAYEPKGEITILNTLKPSSTIYIRKIDGVTGLDLGGAEFVIRDNEGNPYEYVRWSSDGTVKSLLVGNGGELLQDKEYKLVEVNAPKGYLPAEEIVFVVDSSGKISITEGNTNCLNYQKDTITIENYSIAVNIRKQNGFGTLLKGAKLRIAEYDVANGEVGPTIFEFESNNLNPTLVDNSVLTENKRLVAGKTYVLQELEAPDGYQLADDIVFTIGLDGVITRVDGVEVHGNTIVMEDEEAGLAIGKVSLEEQVGLAGCKLEVTTVDDPYFQTMTWVSDGKTKTWDFLTFTPGCTYVLTELEAPDGYAYTDPITFKIGLDDNKVYIVEDGTEKAVKDRTVYIADGILKLSVDKLDSLDNTYVEGATLAVLDSAGNECVRFTTGDGRIDVDTSKLIAGNGYVTDVDTNPDAVKEYTLREVEAPESHYKAVDIRFAIDRDGQIFIIEELAGVKDYIAVDENLLTMYDAPKFSISKQDIAGAEVPGATITITTTEDDNFQTIEFVSGTVPKYFEDGTFTPGITYTLTETNAPDGYAYAESITFKFDADGNLFINGKKSDGKQVVMVDNALAVMISKQDITNSKELAGAKLVIKNEAGEVIHSFVSTNTPTLLPHTLFVAPKPGEMSYYSLTELTAPDGYEIAETIYFALDSSGQVYVKGPDGTYQLMDDNTVVMFDQPTITSGTGISKTPLTGDQVRMKLAILLGMISLFSALVLIERSIFKK